MTNQYDLSFFVFLSPEGRVKGICPSTSLPVRIEQKMGIFARLCIRSSLGVDPLEFRTLQIHQLS